MCSSDLDGYFILLEFDDPNLPPVVFLEGLTGIHFRERKDEIARYREAIEYLRDSALNPRDSLSLMAEASQSFRHQVALFYAVPEIVHLERISHVRKRPGLGGYCLAHLAHL